MLTKFDTITRNGAFTYGLTCPPELYAQIDTIVVTAQLKKATATLETPPATDPPAATFTVTRSDDVDGSGAKGWLLTLSASITKDLDGFYAVDEHIIIAGGGPIQTAPQLLSTQGYVTP